ncbi:MAG: PAS domain S-box protein [Smithellaceae bacterium]
MKDDKTMTREQLLEQVTDLEGRLEACEKRFRSLEDENARYQGFLDDSGLIGCFEIDLKGKMTYANRRNYEAHGYDRSFFMEHGAVFASDEDRALLISAIKSAKKTGQSAIVDYRLRHKNGEIRIVETEVSLIKNKAGEPIGYRGVSRDATERRMLTSDLQRYKDFVENVADGCYEIDLKGYGIFCNRATEHIMGYTREELSRINHSNFTKPEHQEEIRAIFTRIYQTGQPAKPYQREVIRKDGEIRTVMTSTAPMLDAKGKVSGFRGIIQDVTERKNMEEKERTLKERLYQAQKMEAIGTLAGGVAHDFNNLLMGILGYTSLMLLDIPPGHTHHDKLKAIENIVRSGADLSKQLLGYARGGRYEVKSLNINEVIEKTASMFGRAKKEIEIHQTLLPELWSVEADQVQIEQVLMNLFVNAWQAMPGGGSLYLSSTNVILDEQYVTPFDTKPGPFVKISVTDTGMGMDEQVKARIFEPFFTTKGMGRGTGIGLASVYGIIRGHKGIIAVYSEKGWGANFNIYLPASEKTAVPLDVRPEAQSVQGHETILLAEDEETIAHVTTEMLKSLGYEVLNASTGEEAAEVYRENSERIDLVIMDMIMPGGGGGPAVDKISEINPEVRVLLSSGYSLNGMIKEVMDRGGIRSFIQKPFLINELSEKIREILAKSK